MIPASECTGAKHTGGLRRSAGCGTQLACQRWLTVVQCKEDDKISLHPLQSCKSYVILDQRKADAHAGQEQKGAQIPVQRADVIAAPSFRRTPLIIGTAKHSWKRSRTASCLPWGFRVPAGCWL